uniref:CSON006118 protein n=1 Tax=Culicoides sonorensis TaxID=179676 RepID=A0A336M101_CULSO
MVFVDKFSMIIMANAAITSAVVYKYRFPSIIHKGEDQDKGTWGWYHYAEVIQPSGPAVDPTLSH